MMLDLKNPFAANKLLSSIKGNGIPNTIVKESIKLQFHGLCHYGCLATVEIEMRKKFEAQANKLYSILHIYF